MSEIENIKKAILKTGFLLENDVIATLENDGWNTISNRYYIDDVTSTPREVDIVAYKATDYENITIYTALVISCKKSTENAWVFLTRAVKENDPNIELYPLDYWSNAGILYNMKSESELKKSIISKKKNNAMISSIFEVKKNAFAFQEVNINNGTPQNDKKIYDSIISTIKAMDFEKRSLKNRKRNASAYTFHLISIIDGETFEIDVANELKTKKTDHTKYLNRFIVNEVDNFHLIHFVNKEYFKVLLGNFKQFHGFSFNFHKKIIDQFKNDFLKDYKKRNIFRDKIEKNIIPIIDSKIIWDYGLSYNEIKRIYLHNSKKENTLEIGLTLGNSEIIKRMNNDQDLIDKTKEHIEKWTRFHGEIEFVNHEKDLPDIPF